MKNFLLTLFALLFTMAYAFGDENGVHSKSDSGMVAMSSSDVLVVENAVETLTEKEDIYASGQVRHFNLPDDNMLFNQNTGLVPFAEPRPLTLKEEFHVKRAELLMAKVKAENRFAKFLDASSLIDLPIGVVGPGGNEDYAILIDSLIITPTHAYITVYMCIPVPQSEKKLVFRGDNIRLSNNAGITGDARIFLVNDTDFDLFGSDSRMLIRGGADKTNAIWDCNGFKETNLVADVEFSREWLLPVSGTGNVSCNIQTTISSWNDLVVNVNLQPFTLPSLKGVEFHSKNVVFDFSDHQTPGFIQFPQNYTSPQFIGNDKRLWRGFYMEDLKVILPPEFRKKNNSAPISFSGQHMLIDNRGFSGSVGVANLFTLNEGDMNSWSYSLDSLGMSFVANDLTGAGFKGNIVLPISDDNKTFAYNAIINPGSSYNFNVSTLDSLNFELWKAKVLIEQGSYIEVNVVNSRFRPKAVLTGSMNVNAPVDDMTLFDIQFEELAIMTEAPYLQAKAFSFGSDKKGHSFKSFPISIGQIGFKKDDDRSAALTFNIGIHLTGENDGGFKGDATFNLKSKLANDNRKWKYDGISISEVGIDVDGGSYKMKGRLAIFENNAVYGKGYNGNAQLTFQPGFELHGSVVFGKVDGYRYWYADAFVGIPSGIPFCGVLAFYGFGGGMYHNMEQIGFSKSQEYAAGRTLSGVVYKPNKEVRYGFKATIQVGLTSSKETFNGDATFEMSFNKGGGLRKISFTGNAYLFNDQKFGDLEAMAAMVEEMSSHVDSYGASIDGRTTSGLRPAGKDALISGHLYQEYDFLNDAMYGELEMYVDVFGALKGTGPNGLAGWSSMYYSREEWYIYIGTPDRRVGLSVFGLFKMGGYFMAGDQILGSPPPPPQVTRILGNIDMDYMRDLNALKSGKGVALGGSFLFDTGHLRFMFFYGRFALGAGFDVMLKNYGKEVRCKGRSSPLGINGWYANGQTYAFVEAEIGIRVKILFKRRNIHILSLGAAVVFQAKMPNPVWLHGTVGGKYRVLGGAVSGHCKFKVTIGNKCEIIDGSVLEGLDVIADITPASGNRDIDVFTSPQAVFNFEIDKQFSMTDLDDKVKTYRIHLEHFVLKDGDRILEGDLKWNADKTVVIFENSEVFPPEKDIYAEVVVGFEELMNRTEWVKVKTNGKPVTEKMFSTFNTGKAPDYIPHHNVAYSYPQINQVNFYPTEHPQGYIKLKKGQSYLFNVPDVWIQKGRFVGANDEKYDFNISYANNQVNYTLPTRIPNDQVYSFELVNIPRNSNGALDRNVSEVATKVKVDGEETDTEIVTRKAEGNLADLKETRFYKSAFRTSKYNTFNQKMDALNISSGWYSVDSRGQGIHILGTNIFGNELFDVLELNGSINDKPLITIVAKLENNQYYREKVYPLVYEDYPSLTVPAASIQGRDLKLGIPPVKATYIRQNPQLNNMLSESELYIGSTKRVNSANFIYELPYYMKTDYYELQLKTARYYTYNMGQLTPRRKKILETIFPVIIKGNYQVEVTYTLPGTDKVTTRKSYNINKPF